MAATFQPLWLPIATLLCVGLLATLPGCNSNSNENYAKVQEDGTIKYNTDDEVDPMNYTIYVNKEITLMTNILSTHISNGDNVEKGKYLATDELKTVESDLDLVQEAIDSVDTLHPPTDYEDDREAILTAMVTAQDSLERYRDALNGEGAQTIKECIGLMEGDYATLTGKMQAVYWE